MIIPEGLVRTATELRGLEGVSWLNMIPAIIADCVARWSLTLDAPFPQLSYNYAAPGTLADGTAVVLKVCFPDREFFTEAEALQIYDGRGMVKLLAANLDQGVLLLEHLRPGTSLSDVPGDEQAMSIAVSVMRQLWRPAPENLSVSPNYSFPTFSDWVMRMGRLAPGLIQPNSSFPARWIDYALSLFNELATEGGEQVLLHGDLHQGNILSAEREPWLAIDPKGVVGLPVCETGPLLLNVLPPTLEIAETRRVLDRRTAHLAGELGIDLARLRAWGVVRAVLSSFWTLEDHGHDWEGGLVVAEILAGLSA